MKKICFVTNDIDQIGGIERVISLLSFGFEQDGTVELTILSLFSILENDTFFPLSKKTKLIRAVIPSDMTTEQYLTVFFTNNHFDDVVTFHPGIALLISKIKKKIKDIRWIATEHSYPTQYSWKRRLLNLYVYRKSDYLAVLTEATANYYKKRLLRNIKVIPNPVSFISDECSKYEKKVLAVGRVETVKRFDLLAKAFGNLETTYPDWTLQIAGTGSQYEKMKLIAEDYKNIKLLGLRKDIRELMLDASFLAISSEFEGFSLVAIEAMECGLPIVSTELPSIQSITKGYNAVIFAKQNDIKDLSDKIKYMISNPEIVKIMGAEAKKCAEQYHLENVIERWKMIL